MTKNRVLLRLALLAFSAAPVALSPSAKAQQAKKIPRIGVLFNTTSASGASVLHAFKQGLRELEYNEGNNILLEYRYANGMLERLPALAAELVRLKVDVILASGTPAARAAMVATEAVPIVTVSGDPVETGVANSLARPGGNITGLSSQALELSGKRLELLKEILPKVTRVAVLGSSINPGNAQGLKQTELAARALGLTLQNLDARDSKAIEAAFRTAGAAPVDAMLVLTSPIFNTHRPHVTDLAIKSRLPAIYDRREYVYDGGLMSYGTNFADLYRRAALYVDKILKGVKPSDLPVEQPTKFELVINLKTAKQIGLTMPANVLARADRVIR